MVRLLLKTPLFNKKRNDRPSTKTQMFVIAVVREKVIYHLDPMWFPFDEEWRLLINHLRNRAVEVLECLKRAGLNGAGAFGSVARGDVTKKSDVDIHVPYHVSSYQVEAFLLEKFSFLKKEIVQASPNYIPKGIWYLDNGTSVSIPLLPPNQRELEFYKMAGFVTMEDIKKDLFVLGVDKQLTLIEPDPQVSPKGYWKSSILPNLHVVARKLGVSLYILEERSRVLQLRDQRGRTGVFLREIVDPRMNFEQYFNILLKKKPALRRLLAKRL